MKLTKKIIMSLLFTSLNIEANDGISYDWVEINYGDKVNGSLSEFTTLGGSFSISDSFYLTADASKYRRFKLFDEQSIGVRLGFHKALSEKSDFYAEFGYRNLKFENFDSSGNLGFKIGSRSLLSAKFELITHLEYKDIDIEVISNNQRFNHSQNGLSYGVKSLYKLNKNSHLSFGLSVDDSSVSPSIGYRFNW